MTIQTDQYKPSELSAIEDLQPTGLIPVIRDHARCVTPGCTRIGGHFGYCDKRKRGRHRPGRVAAVLIAGALTVVALTAGKGGLGHSVAPYPAKTSQSAAGSWRPKPSPSLTGPTPSTPCKTKSTTTAAAPSSSPITSTSSAAGTPVTATSSSTPAPVPAVGGVGTAIEVAQNVPAASPGLALTGWPYLTVALWLAGWLIVGALVCFGTARWLRLRRDQGAHQ